MLTPPSTKGYNFGALSYAVIGACIDVQRQLGPHCTEVDYQRALALALRKRGLWYHREVEIPIAYDGEIITRRRADFVIGDESGNELLLELKAASAIKAEDVEQTLLYLQKGGYGVGLLVNLGQKPLAVKRFVNRPGRLDREGTK